MLLTVKRGQHNLKIIRRFEEDTLVSTTALIGISKFTASIKAQWDKSASKKNVNDGI